MFVRNRSTKMLWWYDCGQSLEIMLPVYRTSLKRGSNSPSAILSPCGDVNALLLKGKIERTGDWEKV